jgi:hypothetical protein
MNSRDIFLAIVGPQPEWLNFLAMAFAILLVAIASLVFFLLFRGRPRHRKHHHRQRREPRKLNPTLAQTGGLPPVRKEKNPGAPTPPP